MKAAATLNCFLLIAASILFSTKALDTSQQPQQVNKLRGSDSRSIESIENHERELSNNNSYNYNNGSGYGSGNNNNARSYVTYGNGGYGYQNRRYGYNRYGGYYVAQQSYYNQNDDANAADNAADDAASNNDDGADADTDDANSSGDDTFSNVIPSDLEEKFWQWYESPPSQWTAAQWAWFGGILSVTVGFMFCCCLGCANLCMEGQERACNPKPEFDDYTSIDSDKRGSFMTLNTKPSASTNGDASVNTDNMDDDATYDSIMRLRSS
jgi:hypothetical protein